MGRRQGRNRGARRRRPARAITALCWAGAVLGLALAAGAVSSAFIDPLSPTTPGWLASLASDLVAQSLALVCLSAIAAALLRRWGAALVCMPALLVLTTLLLGVDRAPRAGTDAAGPTVRVMTINALAQNDSARGLIDALLESDADVVMLNEPSRALLASLRADPEINEAYPHNTLVHNAGPGFRFMLSRHPLLERASGFGAIWPEVRQLLGPHGQRVARVETPAGPFVFVGVQLRSPRRPDRWAAGNEQARDLALGLAEVRSSTLLPVIVAGDFNASPTGRRSRELAARAGLRRVKPLLARGGTYPAGAPIPAAIDGFMVSEGVRVRRWWTVPLPGSDHRGVIADLVLPGVPSPEPSSQSGP